MKSQAKASSRPPVTAAPFDGADDRDLGEGHGVPEPRQVRQLVHAQVAEVQAGAEGGVGPGDDDAAGVLALIDGRHSRRRQSLVHGVASLGPVQRDHGHPIFPLDAHYLLAGHAAPPR